MARDKVQPLVLESMVPRATGAASPMDRWPQYTIGDPLDESTVREGFEGGLDLAYEARTV